MMIELNNIYLGDCLELMKDIPDGAIDLIISDLPYGVTARNKWDVIIPSELFWPDAWRVLKKNGVAILFGQDKFTAKMMLSDPNHRYNIIWEKTTPTGFLNANRMPLRSHEDMMVFYQELPTYNPQKTTGHDPVHSYTKYTSDGTNYGETKLGISGGGSTERYPKSIWTFATDKQKSSLSPTQKPVLLIEELIKTYSNEGDTILDCTAGSGTTAVACINTNRNYILMEKDEHFYQVAKDRIRNHKKES